MIVERDNGDLAASGALTIEAYLERWLAHKERSVKPNTLRSYRDTLRLHIVPRVGQYRLARLTALHVEQAVGGLLEDGSSPNLAAYALKVLGMALEQAVRWRQIPRNPADAVTPPRRERREMLIWAPAQALAFLSAAETHRLYALFYLALTTGLRRGELLGLRWSDLDAHGRRLTVRSAVVSVGGKPTVQEPKTKAGRRRVDLSDDTLAALAAHRERQAVELERLGVPAPAEGFVFLSETGTLVDPAHLGRTYNRLVESAGVPRIRFHDLRHTHASLLFRSNVPMKTVADRLGHTRASFTQDTYVHLMEEHRTEAALGFSRLFETAEGKN